METALERERPKLAAIGAHHVVVYASTSDAGRVFVTIGIRQRQPIRELIRSRVVFEWFDEAGVEHIPAVFAGETVAKIDTEIQPTKPAVAGTIVAVMSCVNDVAALVTEIHGQSDRYRLTGTRKLWIYQAFDNEREVMILQEVDDEAHARRWLDRPDVTAEWMLKTGLAPYPPPFVGSLAHVMKIDASA